jgi:hypothetical protein
MTVGRRLLIAAALCLGLVSSLFADTRKDNIDVIIALDKSLSMETKIGAVEAWVNSYIIDQLLIPGDYFILIDFFGKAEVAISQTIESETQKAALKKTVQSIRGNGPYTDIGNALDVVKEQIATRNTDGKEKYVLLLTDGIQEAPPASKYYSKNGEFNHEFLANTKTIQEKGWKVMILGIGTDTAAKDLAQQLSGSYTEVSNTPTLGSLTDTTGGLFGGIAIDGPIAAAPIAANGASSLSFTLKASGLAGDTTIVLNDITATVGTRFVPWVLDAPFSVSVKKDSSTRVSIPVHFSSLATSGSQSATLNFGFTGTTRFSPAQAPVNLRVNSWLQNNLILLIVAGVILILLIIFLIILIWRLTAGKPMRFAVVIQEDAVGETVSLSSGKELFLNENGGAFALVPKKNGKSLARFTVKDGKLVLTVLKQDRFPKLKDAPPDARGKTFILKSENGRSLNMKVQSKERKK